MSQDGTGTSPSSRSESTVSREQPAHRRGRGALSNAAGRYEVLRRCDIEPDHHDGWNTRSEDEAAARTVWHDDTSRSILTRNSSPDIYFDQSVNPYRGCEHGCIYCYARPTHAWLDLSPGLDFESRLFQRPDIVELLRHEFSAADYQPTPLALSGVTDAYQPIERNFKLTQKLLAMLLELRHPVSIVTKSALVERDIELLSELASKNLVEVAFSVTTLNRELARRLERVRARVMDRRG